MIKSSQVNQSRLWSQNKNLSRSQKRKPKLLKKKSLLLRNHQRKSQQMSWQLSSLKVPKRRPLKKRKPMWPKKKLQLQSLL